MALSDDLRERVVGTVVEGGMSRNAAANPLANGAGHTFMRTGARVSPSWPEEAPRGRIR